MKKIIAIGTVLLFIHCSTEPNQEQNPSINTQAIISFWKLVDDLKTDDTLNDKRWDSYYNLIGNKNYMENNRSKENAMDHRRFLELVFQPSLADSLLSVEKNQSFKDNDIFQNLLYLKHNETALRAYTEMISSPAYFKDCVTLAKKFLPKGAYEDIPNDLTIYIQAFTYDAAVQDNSMYFGLSVVHDFDKLQKGTVAAHELHHILRRNKALKNSLSTKDSASYSIVNQINNEGVADLIDKVLVVEQSEKLLLGPMFKEWLLGNVNDVVMHLDTALATNAMNKDNGVNKKEFREITRYSSGHIPGFYMVRVMERNGYLEELINHSDNPFNFFYLYNKAAKVDKENPAVFSEATMSYLHLLEKKAYN